MARKNLPKLFPSPTMCQGKRRYTTQQEAKQVAAEQELLQFAQDLQLTVYKCAICSGWHLTRHQE